jgi:hypothetical protein
LQRPLQPKGKHQQLKGDQHGHDPIRPATRKPIHHTAVTDDDPVPYKTNHFKGPAPSAVHYSTTKKPKNKNRTTRPKPTAIKIGSSEYKIPKTRKPKKKPSKQSIAQWIISQSKKPEEKLPSAVIWVR